MTASHSLGGEEDTAGRQTERQRMLTHWRPSGLMGKNSRRGSLQNVSSCFWPDSGMEIAALYKAQLIWGQLEPVRKHSGSSGLCCSPSAFKRREACLGTCVPSSYKSKNSQLSLFFYIQEWMKKTKQNTNTLQYNAIQSNTTTNFKSDHKVVSIDQ